MSFSYGKNIKISIFGQSHSPAMGVVFEGLPAGEKIDIEKLQQLLDRRAPGKNSYSTTRKEADIPEFVSGLVDGATCGAPLCAVIQNTDTKSGDYAKIADIPRPGHADFPAFIKFGGSNDIRGGGQFSGRLTAPLCIAGAICKQLLEKQGITIGTHIYSIHGVKDTPFDPVQVDGETLVAVSQKQLPVFDDSKGKKMLEEIQKAQSNKDSVGGIIEFAAIGLPVGIGTHMFEGIENRISSAIFGIPAVKGIEFGAGFDAAELYGSQNNDSFYYTDNGEIKTRTNNSGGVLGGMTTGMPLIFRVAIKPTPSIAAEQNSISLTQKQNAKLVIVGRHDPCIVPRAVPCIEAAAAIAIYDCLVDYIN
ncbi:MAG: chorismate synthase [Clostridiales bacterium GWF2_38_85]|nr:MAG: chorismate synthase [Clostridiales bacterium GWF2_38_85]HBL85437.1 chorismate synthase [Clostridiales bacterium]